jgi:hypothetical protein
MGAVQGASEGKTEVREVSVWKLEEVAQFTRELEVYRQRRRKTLVEAIRESDGNGRLKLNLRTMVHNIHRLIIQ